MKLTKMLAGFALAVGLSACASPNTSTAVSPELVALSANWRLVDVRVNVPSDLSVSEANRYYPGADIVWRGDPFGDRRAQVAKIVDDGMTRGLVHLRGKQPVIFDVTLSRFHSLTEKARNSIGGVHNIIYTMSVIDARSGKPLHSPIVKEIGLEAFGGNEAYKAEREGQTQKVRIQNYLAGLMRQTFIGAK